jgi:hypothetical protein
MKFLNDWIKGLRARVEEGVLFEEKKKTVERGLVVAEELLDSDFGIGLKYYIQTHRLYGELLDAGLVFRDFEYFKRVDHPMDELCGAYVKF